MHLQEPKLLIFLIHSEKMKTNFFSNLVKYRRFDVFLQEKKFSFKIKIWICLKFRFIETVKGWKKWWHMWFVFGVTLQTFLPNFYLFYHIVLWANNMGWFHWKIVFLIECNRRYEWDCWSAEKQFRFNLIYLKFLTYF